jgi:hypothetical protein
MDVGRTIQFILESQARAEVRMEKADARTVRADARVAAMEKRLDRRMAAITKLLQQGMRMLAKTDVTLAELAVAQKETDRSLKAFIKSMRAGGNGRSSPL